MKSSGQKRDQVKEKEKLKAFRSHKWFVQRKQTMRARNKSIPVMRLSNSTTQNFDLPEVAQ